MSDFTYNQFKNPTNQGIYYANHFHNLDTGISHSNNSNNNYPGYSVTSTGCNSRCGKSKSSNDPRMNQRVYIKENNSFPDNNKPILRKHTASISEAGGVEAFISPSIITQPTTRDDSEKYTTSLPRIPITQGEHVAKKKWQNIYFDKVAGIDGILDIYSNSSERQDLRIAQNSLSLASSSGDGTGIDLSSVGLHSLGEGVFSYLDYDQSNITEDSNGIKTMTILPLREPGPPSEFNVVINLNGGIGGTTVTEGLLSALNKRPPIKYHGKPTQQTSSSSALDSIGIKETIMKDISGDHFHYFPIRDNILNGYVANHAGQEHPSGIPEFPNTRISKYYGTKKPHMSLQISHSHPVNFRLF